jgi:predicted ABC-type ATPase
VSEANLIVLAGPNGAGKSTAAPDLLRGAFHVEEFVNADVIARGLSAFHPEAAAIDAGRVMLARLRELAAQRKDFAFETTLSSRTFAPWIRELKKTGYRFHLFYLWGPTPDWCIDRVYSRKSVGGHFVPEETIRRRYAGGLRNFFTLYAPIATSWQFLDNSVKPRRLVAESGPEGSPMPSVFNPDVWDTISKEFGNG